MVNHVELLLMAILGGLAGCSADDSASAPVSAHASFAPRLDAHGGLQDANGDARDMNRGAQIYNGNCVACHQQDARGVAGVYPSLAGSPVVLGDPQELASWVVKGRRPPSMPAGRYSTAMTQFGWMNERDAAALFTFLRSHFGNSAPAVDAASVAPALRQ